MKEDIQGECHENLLINNLIILYYLNSAPLCPQAAEAGGLNLPAGAGQEAEGASKIVKPEPGFCVKTKDDKGNKIFINICKTEHVRR